MLKKLSSFKLKFQLMLLVSLALIMMILALVTYYFGFVNLTKKRASVYFESIISQMESKITESIDETVNTTKTLTTSYNLQKYILEQNDLDKYTDLKFMLDSMNYTIECSNSIQSIKMIDRQGNQVNSGSGYNMLIFNKVIMDYNLQYGKCNTAFFTRTYTDDNGKVYYAYVCPIYAVLQGTFSKNNIAVCIVLCNSNLIKSWMKDLYGIPGFTFWIREKEGGPTIITNATPADQQVFAVKAGHDYMSMKDTMPLTGWKIDCMVRTSSLTEDMQPILYWGFSIFLVTAILLVMVIVVFNGSFNRQVNHIVNTIRMINSKDTNYRIEIFTANEFGFIAGEINMMLDKINDYTNMIITTQRSLDQAEIDRKKTELMFLQNQINPHFLYNSLECIRSIAHSNKMDQIALVASSMAKMFRYSIKEDHLVTVRSEINCVMDYFNVMSVRYSGRFRLIIDIPDELLPRPILKMTMQPIIENSILHGFSVRKSTANILIRGRISDGKLVLLIADNGKGIGPQQLLSINTRLNDVPGLSEYENSQDILGFMNINRRIIMNHGTEYGLHIQSKENYYTIVMIQLPLL